MADKSGILTEEEIERIRREAWKAIAPLRPASSFTLDWGKRTKAGRALPAPYLVYFLLVELLRFPFAGRGEKIAWSIAVEFDGKLASVEHRKLGLGIFSPATAEDEAVAEHIVKAVDKGVRAAEAFFAHLAAEAVKHSQLNVTNNSGWLFNRYEYLRDEFREKMRIAESRKGEVEVEEEKNASGSTVSILYSYPAVALAQEARWIGIAAIEAFFGWTEHVLIHIGILEGKIRTGEDVAKLAADEWSEKVKVVLSLGDRESKKLYDELLAVRRQIRNYMAHGAFGKQGEAFQFHSKAGAVPVLLMESSSASRFGMLGHPEFDEAAAIALAEAFIEHLWSAERAPARLYVQEAALPVILTFATDGTYQDAMASVEDMERFIRGLTYEMDTAVNMDW